jgi:GNAT superfamily N-acetyltransferase
VTGTARLAPPHACDAAQLEAFERMVREGFEGSDAGLSRRIHAARWLAFHCIGPTTLAAIAALKAPAPEYRDDVFAKADAGMDPQPFGLELGWVFVLPEQRRQGVAAALCRTLLAREPGHAIFATTRPDNAAMIGILSVLGFDLVGKPYRHVRRGEDLSVFVRRPTAEPDAC